MPHSWPVQHHAKIERHERNWPEPQRQDETITGLLASAVVVAFVA